MIGVTAEERAALLGADCGDHQIVSVAVIEDGRVWIYRACTRCETPFRPARSGVVREVARCNS